MPNPFDSRSLILVIMLTLTCRALILGYVWAIARNYRPLKYWTIGSILIGAGSLLFGLRDLIPLMVSVLCGNTLIMSGWLFINAGNLSAAGRRIPWILANSLILLSLSITSWYLLITPDFGMRTVVASFPLIVFDLYASWLCLSATTAPWVTTLRLLAGTLLLVAVSDGFHTWYIFTTDRQSIFDPHWEVVQFYLVYIMAVVVMTVIFVLLALQNLQEKLD